MYPEYTHYAFRQNAGDGYHYAWARIRVESFDNVCIDEMAYCTIPNYPLQWGQTNITEGLEEETIKTDFTVYPNPAKNVLFVETRRATSLPDPTYRITNLMGQTQLQGCITAENQQINIENLPAGMYFISMDNQTTKFIVR